MTNPKRQTPKPRESPKSKHQSNSVREMLPDGWPNNRDGAFLLKDDPTPSPESRHPFDLEERTALFGEAIVRFSKKIPRDPSNNRLIDQVVGAGTSVGANYCEADERVSKKDFKCTIGRCAKEAKESMFFLRMIATAEPELAEKRASSIAKR